MLQKLNRQRGKRSQVAVAEIFEGLNIGTLGGTDVITSEFSIEVKDRAKFVAEGWMQQAEYNCMKNTIPLFVVHLRGTRHTNDLVTMRMKDFLSLLENWNAH